MHHVIIRKKREIYAAISYCRHVGHICPGLHIRTPRRGIIKVAQAEKYRMTCFTKLPLSLTCLMNLILYNNQLHILKRIIATFFAEYIF